MTYQRKIPNRIPRPKANIKAYTITLTEYHAHEDAYVYYMDGDKMYSKSSNLVFVAANLSMAHEFIKGTPYSGRIRQLQQSYE